MKQNHLIRIVAGEQYTPFSLAQKIGAKILLESSSLQKGKERYSLLLVKLAFTLSQEPRGIVLEQGKTKRLFKVESKARDILDVVRYFADQHQAIDQDFPFPAGGVGYISYEFARFCDDIKFAEKPDPLNLPDAHFMFGHTFVVIDHYTDNLILIGLNYKEAQIDLHDELETLEQILASPIQANDEPELSAGQSEVLSPESKAQDYMSMVESVKREVFLGNLLQAVPSRRETIKTSLSALEAYRSLRRNNPSPYLFYADFGSYQLFGSSPETHIKVRHGVATMKPIAGTRRRSPDRQTDLDREQDLLSDPKEKAEHLMLVDLARNDLGRVSEPGSVRVTEYMSVERYSHVMHIVSTVEGRLDDKHSGIDALRATFPSGTVSGAPKIRAMEIISRLEPEQRRFYAGALGYVEPGGELDTCIMIRCALKKGGNMYFQAGAGVVFDSTPAREYEETREKIGALAQSVKLEALLSMEAQK